MLRLANFADLSNKDSSSSSPLGVNGGDGASSFQGELPLCSHCSKPNLADFASVVWETMQFCDADCLAVHQRQWAQCSTCDKTVVPTSMGKYCVRFGSNIRQFCSNQCLEDHKRALKVCYFCQRDILGGEGFLAPVGGDGRGQFKDFCAQSCLKRYQVVYQGEQEEKEMAQCAVCGQRKQAEVELVTKPGAPSSVKSQGSFPPFVRLCGPPCASAYKFANGVRAVKCDQCAREFDDDASATGKKRQVMYYGGHTKRFCGEACKNVFVMRNRSIVPCVWCKVKKYNFDMVEKWTDERTR